jgi:hypothetical protein
MTAVPMRPGAKLDPGLGFVLAVMLFASAVFTLAAPIKGASHHGTHVRTYAMAQSAGSSSYAGGADGGTSPVVGLEALLATPWLEDASHAVMCVGMGFMLILML